MHGLQVCDPRLLLYGFFNGFQEVFDPSLLLYWMFFQWCTGNVWSKPPTVWLFNDVQRCFIHAFCYLVLQWFYKKCIIYAFYFMVLQWVTGGVWSTPPTVWLCNSSKEEFTQRLLLYRIEIVYKSIWSPPSSMVLQWFTRVFDLRLFLWFCNGLQECLIHAFCYMVLQWFPRGIWSTSAAIWFCIC